jgi:hypothetical protein
MEGHFESVLYPSLIMLLCVRRRRECTTYPIRASASKPMTATDAPTPTRSATDVPESPPPPPLLLLPALSSTNSS